jgi:AcrR family transcriptional regulator
MFVNDAQLEWVKRPLQARSQQTFERLLDAAEAIIEEKGLESATVAEIAKRADSSVGAFYSRFADKEGLTRCLFERFTEQALATSETILVAERWAGVPVCDAIETMILFMLRVMRERRKLLIAMMMRSAKDPSITALSQHMHERISTHMHRLMEQRGERVAHPDPEAALSMGVWMVLSAVESRIVYAWGDLEQASDEAIAVEVTRMVLSYLGIDSKYGVYAPPPVSSDTKRTSKRKRSAAS